MWTRKLLRPCTRFFSKLHVLDAGYMGHVGASATYLLENDQREILCVDPGVTSSVQGPLRHFFEANPDVSLKYVVVTHAHLDHHGGCGYLLNEEPYASEATVLCHPSTLPHLLDPTLLVDGTRALYGDEIFDSAVGEVDAISDASRIVPLHDGAKIHFYEDLCSLQAFHVRGHTNNHLVLHDIPSRSLFAGDAFGMAFQGGKTHVPCWPPTAFAPTLARDAIEFQMSLPGVEHVYVTHFGEVELPGDSLDAAGEYLLGELDVFESWIQDCKELLQDYDRVSPYMTKKERKGKGVVRSVEEIILNEHLIPSMLDRYVEDPSLRSDDRWRHIMWLNAEGVLSAAKKDMWSNVIQKFFQVVHEEGQVDRADEFAHPDIVHVSSADEVEHVGRDVMVKTIHSMHEMFGENRKVSLNLDRIEGSTFYFDLEYVGLGAGPDKTDLVLRSQSEWTLKDDEIFYARANVLPQN